jgi:hypothetical protein
MSRRIKKPGKPGLEEKKLRDSARRPEFPIKSSNQILSNPAAPPRAAD